MPSQLNEEITISKARSEHFDQVLRLLKESFITREPICSSLGLDWDSDMKHFQTDMLDAMEQDCSFVALNPQGRVIGCRISSLRQIDPDQYPEPDYVLIPDDTPKCASLRSMLRSLMQGWTKEMPDSHSVLEFILMCVEEKYGGYGIAQRLVNKSLGLAQDLNADYVYTVATNWRSQRVFDKLGFTSVRTRNYDEFIDDQGNPLVNMNDGSTCMKWMIKKIRKD